MHRRTPAARRSRPSCAATCRSTYSTCWRSQRGGQPLGLDGRLHRGLLRDPAGPALPARVPHGGQPGRLLHTDHRLHHRQPGSRQCRCTGTCATRCGCWPTAPRCRSRLLLCRRDGRSRHRVPLCAAFAAAARPPTSVSTLVRRRAAATTGRPGTPRSRRRCGGSARRWVSCHHSVRRRAGTLSRAARAVEGDITRQDGGRDRQRRQLDAARAAAASTVRSTAPPDRRCWRSAAGCAGRRTRTACPSARRSRPGAGDLPARWVIHTVGPNRYRGQDDPAQLASCFTAASTWPPRSARGRSPSRRSARGVRLARRDVARIAVDAVRRWAGPAPETGATVDVVRFVLFGRRAAAAFETRSLRWMSAGGG